ncbi:MAG: protein kinase [Anaerolineaceae bacterium]|nr:protein kinase [Anaerolineaceae bacterium]
MLDSIIFEQYAVKTQICKNDWCTRYEGVDTRTGQQIIIHAFHPTLVPPEPLISNLKNLERKIKDLDSSYFPLILSTGEVDKIAVMICTSFSGESVTERIDSVGLPSPNEVIELAYQLGNALDMLHKNHFLQGVLTLQEVVFSSEGEVQLTLPALASLLDLPALLVNGKLPEHGYYAPELMRGNPADIRSDLYTLGAVLFEAITGKPVPKPDLSPDRTMIVTWLPSRLRKDIPPALDDLIATCLNPEVDKRYANIQGFLSAVNDQRASSEPVASILGMEDALVGQTLGGYRLVDRLGQGGMATVYKAYEPALDRFVAIKVLPQFFANDPGFTSRFRREAKAVAQLNHPNIVPIYSFGESSGITYIAMQYVEGDTLKHERGEKLDVQAALRLLLPITRALGYAHQRGIIHRDVKPSNVLLNNEGWPLLADFGLAKMAEASNEKLTGTGVGMGTPTYMSPEQGQGIHVDHRSDIYSLGIMLYKFVTGDVPFHADTPMAIVIKHISASLPLPRHIDPSIPEVVENIILKATAKAPADRFQTAEEMAKAMEAVLLGNLDAAEIQGLASVAFKAQAEKAAKAEKWQEAVQAWESFLALESGDRVEVEEQLQHARKYARIDGNYNEAQESIRKKHYGRAMELLLGIIAQDPTYKSTSRLLVEAEEANKAIPLWRRARVWGGLTAAVVLVIALGFGIVWLGQQDFTFPTAGSVPTKTSTATRAAPSVTPTPTLDPELQAALDTIQSEEPLYQTSFDDWDTNDSGRNAALMNGNLILRSKDENGAVLGLNVFPADRYVVEFEFSISEDTSADGLCVYEAWSDAQFDEESWRAFSAEFYPGEDLAVLSIFDPQSREQPRIATASFDKTKSNMIRLVVLEDQITVFINGQLAYTAQDPSGSAVYFGNNLAAYNQVTCEFDHFKYWDLRDVDPAVKTALAAIQSEEPLYQTSFDDWEFGDHPDNATLENGKLVLVSENQEHVGVNFGAFPSDNFAVEFEFRVSRSGPGSCFFGTDTGGDNNETIKALGIGFDPNSQTHLEHYVYPDQYPGIADGSYADIELNKVTLIVHGGTITVFVNGKLMFDVPNPDGNTIYSRHIFSAEGNNACEFDNYKFWDFREMDPAVKTALATIQNKEPDYQTDFDDANQWEFINNARIEDGKLVITGSNGIGGLVDLNNFSSDRFVVEFELHNLGADSAGNCFFQTGNDQRAWSESWKALVPQFQKQDALLARFKYPDLEDFVWQGYTGSNVNTVTLLILGDQITAFVNGKLIYTTVNPDGSIVYSHHSLGAYGATERAHVCEFDNYKYWDLSGVDFFAATSTSGTTSSFASILDSVADKTPDYEDDFSNLASGWRTDRNSTGNETGYQDGAYLISAKNGCYGAGLPTDRVFSDFVLELDARFINQEHGSVTILFRDNETAHYGANIFQSGWFNFHKNVNNIHFDLLGTEVPESTFQAWDDSKHLTLIAWQDKMALYVNGELVIALTDSSSSQGRFIFGVCEDIDGNPLQVLIDNLKIWDITDLSP